MNPAGRILNRFSKARIYDVLVNPRAAGYGKYSE